VRKRKHEMVVARNINGKNNIYQGTSATTSGWLNILAALCLLLVGMGSPAGV